QLSDRDERSKWEAAGAKDAKARAAEKAREILDQPLQTTIPSSIREQIKGEIPGLRSFVMD
ncbi:MAG: trimethylamine methyltransferase family protein, partial [Deltaproteobacteria bacterium]|nr:trimethylamine methyltransferase family protein [Deltaproteobacteria bacterium]